MSIEILGRIRLQLGYYSIPVLIITGNIGNLFLAILLGRGLKRQVNSCSLYLFVATFANWLLIDTALISTYYGLFALEPTHASNVLCKLRWYGGHCLFMLSRCCMIAACIDRWALCSRNARIRMFCQPQNAYRVLAIVFAIAILSPTQLFAYFDNSTGRCALLAQFALPFNIFAFIAIGVVPLLLIIIFSLLARNNLRSIRARVHVLNHSVQSVQIHKRDHDLMKMLAGEVIIYCVTNVTYPINLLYTYLTQPSIVDKTPMRLAVESLISFVIHPLCSFTYCCTQFYVCLVVSTKFRKELIQLFRRRINNENMNQSATHPTDVKSIIHS